MAATASLFFAGCTIFGYGLDLSYANVAPQQARTKARSDYVRERLRKKHYRRNQSRKPLFCKFEGIDFEERTSPVEVKKEIEKCYELIGRLGRGVVYLGSARLGPNHPHYVQAFELGKEIASLLNCTSWSGAGPGLMDAATKGALEAGKPVGGFKIGKEAGQWTATNIHPYLPLDSYLTCR